MIRPGSLERSFRATIGIAGDFVVAWWSLTTVVYLRRTVPLAFTRSLLSPEKLPLDPIMVMLFGAAFLAGLGLAGFYRRRIALRGRPIVMVALLIQIALVTIGTTVLERPLPRSILLAVPLLEALAFPIWRSLQQKIWPVRPRETILVGDPAEVAAAIAVLRGADDQRVRVIGYVDGDPAETGVPWLGRLDDPAVRSAIHEVEEVICVWSEAAPRGRLELLRIRGPRGYLLLASSADALLVSSVLGWMGDEPLIEVMVGCGFGANAIVKRGIDVAVSIALAVLTIPVWIVIAAAVWLDDHGPVLFRQMRTGRGGVPFAMWKFRSMRAPRAGSNAKSDDERVTRVGRFLRRYHIDELPQLINVITGEMSLVGPRPERPEIAARILEEVPDFDLRCLVRPGMAGLAQSLVEYDSRPSVKLRYDLTYMCSWSLWLDIRLMFRSVAAALSGSGV
ncbi:MAG TPA: sugar transferase [Thermoanaerobaculia bacterium]|jgi:lipopolysaccharide/colanic/teichoic acid biosynthesis glycosyltransferase|nr:sugar transferase [Thermoanaerobaculia bacterium]